MKCSEQRAVGRGVSTGVGAEPRHCDPLTPDGRMRLHSYDQHTLRGLSLSYYIRDNFRNVYDPYFKHGIFGHQSVASFSFMKEFG